VFAGGVIVLVLALLVETKSPVLGVLLCIALLGVILLVMFGLERVAFLGLLAAFATAPMYRGLAGLSGGHSTPTDLLLVLSCAVLVPVLMSRPLDLPSPYVVGLTLVAVTSLVTSVLSDVPAASLFGAIRWLFFLGVVPIVIAWWRPGLKSVVALLWAYVIGQVASTAYALAVGPVVGNRYQGLSHHTNAFGMGGVTAVAILLFLFAHHRDTSTRLIVLGAGVVTSASVVMSGSRAAVVVAAVLLIIVPVVERSAVLGFIGAVFGAMALIAFPLLVGSGHGGPALTRLAGDATAARADQARGLGLDEGLRRFWDSPVVGSGLNNVEIFHNVFLEVLVSVGIFGLFGYLMVMFILARPLIGRHPHRRLAYLPLAFIGMAPALPGIWDETMWVPISLCILAVFDDWPTRPPDDDAVALEVVPEREAPIIVRY
jgi:hypothetical protein